MSNFNGDDYEFAVGDIKGIRSWKMDDLGRLTGVTHKAVWLPGENVSDCKARKRVPCPNRAEMDKRSVLTQTYSTVTYGIEAFRSYNGGSCDDSECFDWSHPSPSGHAFDPNCECGFWAYDESHLKEHGDVVGIIAGYGRTTVGSKGFRCEKARIIALCRETEESRLSLSSWLRLQQIYPEAEFFEEQDGMVSAHGAVLRTWEPVGEDFWTRVLPPEEDTWSSLTAKYLQPALYNIPWRP